MRPVVTLAPSAGVVAFYREVRFAVRSVSNQFTPEIRGIKE